MSKPKDDLISRAAALDAIDCWHIDFNSMDGAKVQTDCWRTIKELPAVDAVPVIRCRDCQHWVCADTVGLVRYGDCTNGHSIISRHAMPNENYYCADGERRGEGETGND